MLGFTGLAVYLILKHIQICSIYIEPMILGPSSFLNLSMFVGD